MNNLTGLWKIAGQLAGQFIEKADYQLSTAKYGDWPNRLWFNDGIDVHTLERVLHRWKSNNLFIPIWWENDSCEESIIRTNGFELRSTQVGMSLTLEHVNSVSKRLQIIKVSNKALAETWSQLFHLAFGYEINPHTIENTKDKFEYLIGTINGIPVGTAVLYVDKYHAAGIHSMGIIPSHRRKGFAEELLLHIINRAKSLNANQVFLQASEMGKILYLKTGFKEDFILKTFTPIKNKQQ